MIDEALPRQNLPRTIGYRAIDGYDADLLHRYCECRIVVLMQSAMVASNGAAIRGAANEKRVEVASSRRCSSLLSSRRECCRSGAQCQRRVDDVMSDGSFKPMSFRSHLSTSRRHHHDDVDVFAIKAHKNLRRAGKVSGTLTPSAAERLSYVRLHRSANENATSAVPWWCSP
jgi:hypothetical protein